MTIHDFTKEPFCRVDDAMTDRQKHSQAVLHPGEVVTLGLLFALKGAGNRAFYRWAEADLAPLFPHLPERTRFFRLLAAHQDWTNRFLAQPSLLGVVDSFGIEPIHPRRQGRSDKQKPLSSPYNTRHLSCASRRCSRARARFTLA